MTDYIERQKVLELGYWHGEHRNLAAPETQKVVNDMCEIVQKKCPEFFGLLTTHCWRFGWCEEMNPCERGKMLQNGRNTGN